MLSCRIAHTHINRWEFSEKRLKRSYVSNLRQKLMMVDAAVEDVQLFISGNTVVTAEYDQSGRISSCGWVRIAENTKLDLESLKVGHPPGNQVRLWNWYGMYPAVGAN